MEILTIKHTDFVIEILFKGQGGDQEFRKIYNHIKAKYKEGSFVTDYTFSDFNLLQEFLLWDPTERFLVKTHIDEARCPVFFENKEYSISIEFLSDIKRPFIYAKSKSISEAFNLKMIGQITPFLFANLTFKNDIGYIEFYINYEKGTISKTILFRFRVFSLKFDIERDFPVIVRDIEHFYPRLVLDFMKKTYHHFDSASGDPNDLVWWIVFCNIYKRIISNLQFIIEHPYRKLIACEVLKKRDQIINPAASLSEKIRRYTNEPDKQFIVRGTKSLEDNYENRIVKFILKDIVHKFKKIYALVMAHSAGKRMTNDYKDQLEFVDKALRSLLGHYFFQSVGDIREIKAVTHVLTMRPGYSDLYKNWCQLNGGYKFFEGSLEMEMKDIAYLYQIWCFFGMTELIKSIGAFIIDIVKVPKIMPDQFILSPDKDMNSKIIFKLADGTIIELYHEPLYNDKFDNDNAGSLSGAVRPDIVLRIRKNDLPDSPFLTYIFDVKYRLNESGKPEKRDNAGKGDLRQVHHYRDSIYSKNQYTNLLSKEVKGAYIIHPGEENPDDQRCIDLIDIGVFTFNPGQDMEDSMLKKHLARIIKESAITLLKAVPPQKGKNYKDDDALVLVDFIKKGDTTLIHYLEDTDAVVFCYKSFLKAIGDNRLRFLAVNVEDEGIKCFYEILSHQWISRREAYPPDHELFLDSGTKCLVLKLGNKKEFKERLQIKGVVSSGRYTTIENLNNPVDGFIKTIPKGKLS